VEASDTRVRLVRRSARSVVVSTAMTRTSASSSRAQAPISPRAPVTIS